MLAGRRFAAIAIGASLALAAAFSIVYPVLREPVERAPDFTLTDQDGRPFTLSAERGRPYVLFFGYAHCTDACPVTLAHLSSALRSQRRSDTVRVVFVTVDPERDTPAVLRHYVHWYDPRPIALTGTRAQLQPVYDAYHVWTQRQPAGRTSRDYAVAHGTALYFIDAEGRLRGLADWNESGVNLAQDFKKYLS